MCTYFMRICLNMDGLGPSYFSSHSMIHVLVLVPPCFYGIPKKYILEKILLTAWSFQDIYYFLCNNLRTCTQLLLKVVRVIGHNLTEITGTC